MGAKRTAVTEPSIFNFFLNYYYLKGNSAYMWTKGGKQGGWRKHSSGHDLQNKLL